MFLIDSAVTSIADTQAYILLPRSYFLTLAKPSVSWIPSHIGIAGDEESDELALEGDRDVSAAHECLNSLIDATVKLHMKQTQESCGYCSCR